MTLQIPYACKQLWKPEPIIQCYNINYGVVYEMDGKPMFVFLDRDLTIVNKSAGAWGLRPK